MTAQPAGEESRSAPLRHRRSRRQPSFGQINPSKRPFGALGPNRADIKENVAICESTERVGATESNGDELSLFAGGRISASTIARRQHTAFTRAAGCICDPSPFGRCRTRTATKLPLCDDRSRLDAWAALRVAQRQESRARWMPGPPFQCDAIGRRQPFPGRRRGHDILAAQPREDLVQDGYPLRARGRKESDERQ
ncbi:hypothetical protein ABIA45_005140 [Bradyrhizobium sp. USDA 336]